MFKVGEGEWKTRICWIDRYETYTDSQLCLLYAFAIQYESEKIRKGLVQSAGPVYIFPVSFEHVDLSDSILNCGNLRNSSIFPAASNEYMQRYYGERSGHTTVRSIRNKRIQPLLPYPVRLREELQQDPS